MYLYKIENKVNGKQYVGITNNIKRRWREHKNDLKNKKHCNIKLQNSWDKYGEENFVFKKINVFNNLEDMNKAEVDYIIKNNLLNDRFGYNIHEGGNSFKHTEVAKFKISKSNEVSVVSKCLKTGELKVYGRIKDVEKDGLNPKSIANACTGRALTYKNRVWVYKSNYDTINTKYNKYKGKSTKARPENYKKVYGMCIETKKIKKYEAIDHVEKDGFYNQAVRKCCKKGNSNKTHKNWVWSFDKNDLVNQMNKALSLRSNVKKIYKFDLKCNFIEEVNRGKLTKTQIKSIQSVCSGHKKTYKGFFYSYEKTLQGNIDKGKGFFKLDKDNNIIEEYLTIKDLLNKNPFIKSTSGIYKCCNGKRKTAGGFKWSFSGGNLWL